MRGHCLFAAAALLVVPAAPLAAADRVETVWFTPGTFSSIIRSAIKGSDGVAYRIDARNGQVMQVLFAPSNRSCYMNVLPPASDTAIFNGSVTGNEFSKNLTVSGTYKVQVYLMRNAARRGESCKYTISFEVTG